MKNTSLIFIAFLFLQFTLPAQDGWFEQTSGTWMDLHSVFFVNSNVGWAVGGDPSVSFGDGIILNTTDGGVTWIEQQTALNYVWYSVCFVNLNTGFVAGRQFSGGPPVSGNVAKTTDGGMNWTALLGGLSPPLLYSVCFTNLTNGWAVGKNGVIETTTDGGTNWTMQIINLHYTFHSVHFIDSTNGWVVGEDNMGDGIILRTTNGGTDWNLYLEPSERFLSVYFINQNIGWVAGISSPSGNGVICKTTDGGATWSSQAVNLDAIFSIQFINQNIGWAAGSFETILRTTNGGDDWVLQRYNMNSGDLWCTHFVDSNIGWAVGTDGKILRTINGGIPVELTSFSAIADGKEVTLSWSTATETNNSGFDIERKQDNSNWERIGFVEGHGTTTEHQTYSYRDDISNVSSNSIAYRLKQIDFDGSYGYSSEVLVDNLAPIDYNLYQNYPNPFNPATKIKYSIPQSSNVLIKVFDILGNELETLINEEKPAGTYELTWYAESLPSGVYFYRLQAGDFIQTKKMVLIK